MIHDYLLALTIAEHLWNLKEVEPVFCPNALFCSNFDIGQEKNAKYLVSMACHGVDGGKIQGLSMGSELNKLLLRPDLMVEPVKLLRIPVLKLGEYSEVFGKTLSHAIVQWHCHN